MARRRHSRRAQPTKNMLKHLEAVAIYMMASAEDEDEELNCLLLGLLIMQYRKPLRNGRYGRRGAYDRKKSEDFFRLMLEAFTPRQFKQFMRYSFVFQYQLVSD